ncbi:CPCC family cysteine-rich protein [Streptomyces sp. NPDC020490]|uniref:CPCC family cysteine-rich protein n=1 Tax=Streptomyces sp. NPDC020490 TaxID=3365078 RepID=UPI0037B6EBB3
MRWPPTAVYWCPRTGRGCRGGEIHGTPAGRGDDGVQFRWPTMDGGADKVSLIEAQRNNQDFGACDQHSWRYVRPPAEDEPLDPAWRPIDLTRDSLEDWAAEDRTPWPDDRSVLCWWLATFWRHNHPAS